MNRLQTATETSSITGSSWSEQFGYDRFGNMWVSGSSGITLSSLTPRTQNDINPNNNRLQAVGGFGYDNAGNLTGDPMTGANALFYDAENRMTTYIKAGQTTQYSYDGDGRRIKKVDAIGATIFVYNVIGQMIAEYTSGTPQGTGTSYLTADHLGSIRVVLDGTGNVKSRRDYLPFGEEISGNIGSNVGGRGGIMGYGASDRMRQRFTGQQRDDESGLDFFEARFYSSASGRFTSIDPVSGTELHPQSWNRYSYVTNNPLRYTDKNGLTLGDSFAEKVKNWFVHGYFETNEAWQRRVKAAREFLKWQEKYRNGLYVRPNYAVQTGPDQYEPGEWRRLDIENLSDDDAVAWAAIVNANIENQRMETLSDEVRAIADAAAGMSAFPKPSQIHHFATNKHKTYTPQMEKIAKKYGLDLDGDWNKESLSHSGRHTSAYHEFVLRGMQRASREAGRSTQKFGYFPTSVTFVS